MEESSKTMEKSSKTMEKWSETLGKSRKMVCRRRCIWGGVRTLESKGVPKQLLSVVGACSCRLVSVGLRCGTIMRKRHCLMVRPRRCIWGGDRWNRRESEEKALLDGHKD